MDGEVKKTADWEPGTLDKTRKNIEKLKTLNIDTRKTFLINFIKLSS